ncbi:hypothetical protein ACPZJU_22260, partial [Cereibacter johrii]
TPEDLKKFRDRHPLGTTAHLWLTLQMFTACRVDDARKLGRRHEVERAGEMWLDSQPGKKGSAPVSIPMMAPLLRAVRAQKVQGATYLLTDYGKPFSTAESLRNRVRKWCAAASRREIAMSRAAESLVFNSLHDEFVLIGPVGKRDQVLARSETAGMDLIGYAMDKDNTDNEEEGLLLSSLLFGSMRQLHRVSSWPVNNSKPEEDGKRWSSPLMSLLPA